MFTEWEVSPAGTKLLFRTESNVREVQENNSKNTVFSPGLPLTMIGEKLGRIRKRFREIRQRSQSNSIYYVSISMIVHSVGC